VTRAILRYQTKIAVFFLLFAGLIIAAEQNSPFNPVKVEDWTSDYLASVQEGNVQREVAYLLIAAVTAALWMTVRRTPEPKIHRKGAITLGLFLAWAGTSTLWSDEPGVLIRRLLTLGIVLCWVYVCTTRWSAVTVLWFVVVSSLADIIVSIMTEVLHGRFTPMDPDYRLSGTLAPNELALNAMVLVVASLTAASMNRKWRRLLLVCVVAGVLTILLTRSRTALIGLVVSVIVFVHLTIQSKAKLAMIWLLTCVSFFAVPIVTGRGISDVLSSVIPRSQDKVGSLSGRVPLWQDCFEHYVLDRPMLGFGYSTFWTRDRITKVSNDQGWGVSAAHSAYLELLLALGLPGLLLYLTLIFFSLRMIRKRLAIRKNRHLVFCACLIWGLLVIGATESEVPFRNSSIYFYSLIAFLLPFVIDGAHDGELRQTEFFHPSPEHRYIDVTPIGAKYRGAVAEVAHEALSPLCPKGRWARFKLAARWLLGKCNPMRALQSPNSERGKCRNERFWRPFCVKQVNRFPSISWDRSFARLTAVDFATHLVDTRKSRRRNIPTAPRESYGQQSF
jgi:exopolysaccharide production protein ExoQ